MTSASRLPFPLSVAPKRAYLLLALLACLSYLIVRPFGGSFTVPARSGDRVGKAVSENLATTDGEYRGVQAPSQSEETRKSDQAWGWEAAAARFKEKLGWKWEDAGLNEAVNHHASAQDIRPIFSIPTSSGQAMEDGIYDSFENSEDPLAFRKHLEQEHPGHAYLKHSTTLTFDHIYVLSLKHRTDRRARMSKMALALALEFTFVDAMDKTSALIQWIGERAKEIRERKRPILAKALGVKETEIGGMGVGSIWLKGNDRSLALKFPDIKKTDKRWIVKNDLLVKYDPGKHVNPVGETVVDWVTYLETMSREDAQTLQPSPGASSEVTDYMYDPLEQVDARQVNDGVLSTWFSQTRVWHQIVQNNDSSALILEDDVDIEWDIERVWPNVERALPKDWEIVFLGHCWGKELEPQYVHPQLHQSSEPRCLHGYALSQAGARHLLKLASDPWRAYQTPIDTFVPYLIRQWSLSTKASKPQILKAFSMEPSVIIQSKDLSSDIQEGIGSSWRGVLSDSTWDRILRHEGKEVKQLTWEDVKKDPAVKARPWGEWAKKPDVTLPVPEVLPILEEKVAKATVDSEADLLGPGLLRLAQIGRPQAASGTGSKEHSAAIRGDTTNAGDSFTDRQPKQRRQAFHTSFV